MLKRIFALGWLLFSILAFCQSLTAQPFSASSGGTQRDLLAHWELDYESGILWKVGRNSTRLDYTLLPQLLTLKSPAQIRLPLAGGDLVLRSRFSLLCEPIITGPEHHFFGASASGILEWWNRARTTSLFFSSGGGFGWLDSRGYDIPGAQGEHFNFNWLIYTGARLVCWRQTSLSVGTYFQHISNGGLDKVNPGIDALGPMLSFGWHF